MTTQNTKNEDQEIKQFISNVRTIGGQVIEFLTQRLLDIEKFFGWPQKRAAKIEAEAEENFRIYSTKMQQQEISQ
jgi:hypothetical protein